MYIYTFINIKGEIHVYIHEYKSTKRLFSFLIFIFINQKRKITFYKFTLINFQNINLKKYKRQFFGNEKWLFFPFSSYSSPQEETNENMRVMKGVILHKYLIIINIICYLS